MKYTQTLLVSPKTYCLPPAVSWYEERKRLKRLQRSREVAKENKERKKRRVAYGQSLLTKYITKYE